MRKVLSTIPVVFSLATSLLGLTAASTTLALNTSLPHTANHPTQTGSLAGAQPVVSWEHDQINPAAAYSPDSKLFLVAWEDYHWASGAQADIYARMLSLSGAPVAEKFGIAWLLSNLYRQPDVAYNTVNDEFLVVYEYPSSITDQDIYARRVSNTGVVIGNEIPIVTASVDETRPAIAYNPVNNQYLVAYQEWDGASEFGDHDIYGVILYSDGTPSLGPFAIKLSNDDESAPDVAFISGLNQYLVIWSDNVGDYPQLKKQFVNPNATLGVSEAGTYGGANYLPRLAANDQGHEYVFVHEYKDYGPPIHFYGMSTFINQIAGYSGGIWPGDMLDEINLDVAFNPFAKSYIIVFERTWSTTVHDVYMQIYDDYTTSFCCLRIGPTKVSAESAWEGNPTASGSNQPVSLVVWEDLRNGATMGMDIYANVVYHGKAWLPQVYK